MVVAGVVVVAVRVPAVGGVDGMDAVVEPPGMDSRRPPTAGTRTALAVVGRLAVGSGERPGDVLAHEWAGVVGTGLEGCPDFRR